MNVYAERFLVVIGGETYNEEAALNIPQKKPIRKSSSEHENNSQSEDSSDQEPTNRPLNDVWVFDIHLKFWREITTTVKVQTSFNSKKMRKIFEPRMAHSANILG